MVEEVEGGEGGVVPRLLVEVEGEGGELGRKERAPEEHQRGHLEVRVFPHFFILQVMGRWVGSWEQGHR